MDKVIKVSIAGMAFTLEKEADNILRAYLDTLSTHYKSNPCGTEIMEGIESRIAELLADRGCRSNVATAAIAIEVTGIIGTPEEICDEPSEGSAKAERVPVRKRLFRNPDGKMIGGVCSGLAAYFNIDPAWLRLAFVVLGIAGIAGSSLWDFSPTLSVLIYCVLWIIMPMARTAEQKSQLHGESLSFEDIERKAAAGQMDDRSTKSIGSTLFSVIGKILLVFGGCIFLVTGFAGILSLVAVIFGLGCAGLALPAVLEGFGTAIGSVSSWVGVTINILSLIVIFIPFAGLLYGGIKLIFGFKAPRWKPGLVMLILWLIAAVALLVIAIVTIPDLWNALGLLPVAFA